MRTQVHASSDQSSWWHTGRDRSIFPCKFAVQESDAEIMVTQQPTAAKEVPRVRDASTPPLRAGALENLRPMAAVASAIMVGFIGYNLADFPPGIRERMVAHDAITAAICASVWWLIRAGRIREDHAHAAATGMILLVASNILLAMWLLRAPYQAIYLCILLVGAGAGMTSIVWGAAVVVMLDLAAVRVLFMVTDTTTVARYIAMMAATSGIAMALIALRARNLRALTHLTELDRQQRAH